MAGGVRGGGVWVGWLAGWLAGGLLAGWLAGWLKGKAFGFDILICIHTNIHMSHTERPNKNN